MAAVLLILQDLQSASLDPLRYQGDQGYFQTLANQAEIKLTDIEEVIWILARNNDTETHVAGLIR